MANNMFHDKKEYLIRRISPGHSYDSLLRFPKYFEIETVNTCNARCSMCTIEEWVRKTPLLKDELFAKIADEICAHSADVNRVSLYRDGEPLLDKKLASRIAYLKQGNVKKVGISTNVALLDENRGTDILKAGLDEIILSIDSLDKTTYENIRSRLKFDEVMENAQRFIELRDRLNPKTQIWMRMIRQESNKDEWPEYEAFWRSKLKSSDRVNYHNLHNWGGQLNNFTPIASTTEGSVPCIALWSLMVIFADGRVPLCNVDYNDKHPTGNIADSSIEEIWSNKIMEHRRLLHLTDKKSQIVMCENCNVWDEPPDKKKVEISFPE